MQSFTYTGIVSSYKNAENKYMHPEIYTRAVAQTMNMRIMRRKSHRVVSVRLQRHRDITTQLDFLPLYGPKMPYHFRWLDLHSQGAHKCHYHHQDRSHPLLLGDGRSLSVSPSRSQQRRWAPRYLHLVSKQNSNRQ